MDLQHTEIPEVTYDLRHLGRGVEREGTVLISSILGDSEEGLARVTVKYRVLMGNPNNQLGSTYSNHPQRVLDSVYHEYFARGAKRPAWPATTQQAQPVRALPSYLTSPDGCGIASTFSSFTPSTRTLRL